MKGVRSVMSRLYIIYHMYGKNIKSISMINDIESGHHCIFFPNRNY